MKYFNGIEDIKRAPICMHFNEGRKFGWIFDVTEPINVTKLMFFNDDEEEIQTRMISLHKVTGHHAYDTIIHREVSASSASWGYDDILDGGITLEVGKYAIFIRVPHYSKTYYVPSPDVQFGSQGIKFDTGLFENINDIGWFTTPNCYMVSFEYTLKNQPTV